MPETNPEHPAENFPELYGISHALLSSFAQDEIENPNLHNDLFHEMIAQNPALVIEALIRAKKMIDGNEPPDKAFIEGVEFFFGALLKKRRSEETMSLIDPTVPL